MFASIEAPEPEGWPTSSVLKYNQEQDYVFDVQYQWAGPQLESINEVRNALQCSGTYTFVKPGRSTSVRSRTLGLYILKLMGSLLIPLFCPATRNVSASISFLISAKSVNRLSVWRNWAYSGNGGCGASSGGKGVCINWRTSGLRVTIPCPRGRKSRPTILKREMSVSIRSQQPGGATYFSRTLDLPADWLPTWHSSISNNSKDLAPVNTYNSKLRHIQLASWAGHTVNTARSKGKTTTNRGC
jgi:hypothetical protein